MLYVANSNDLLILGGTVWMDPGGQWSQARSYSLTTPGVSAAMGANRRGVRSKKDIHSLPQGLA